MTKNIIGTISFKPLKLNNSLHLARKYARFLLGLYLSAAIICAEKRTSFGERSSRNTVSLRQRQIEAIVFIILQIFFATRAVLKIGEYYFGYSPVLADEYSVT